MAEGNNGALCTGTTVAVYVLRGLYTCSGCVIEGLEGLYPSKGTNGDFFETNNITGERVMTNG